MAAIEELIKNIADPGLREQIAEEVAKLKAGKKFGLVFEEHLPEIVRLPSLPVKRGVRVAKKDDAQNTLYRVIEDISTRRVLIEPEGGGESEKVAKKDLVVVKAFGEPMYPALVPVDSIERAPGKPWHTLINADNYHALQLLLYGYEGQVDVIYIDPPYNSGARDWKYNNDYVDASDRYRHSKWLSMMQRRLQLAKRLLRSDGVLICTVDENEVGHLSVLLETLFPDYLRHMVTSVINPKGTGKHNFARVEEYLFFCVPNTGSSIIRGVPAAYANATQPGDGSLFYQKDHQPLLFSGDSNDDSDELDDVEGDDIEDDVDGDSDGDNNYADLPFPADEIGDWELRHARRRGSESSYREQRWNQFYPIFIDEKTRTVVKTGKSIPLGKKPSFRKVGGLTPIWPIDKDDNDRCWRFVSERMQELIDEGKVRLGRFNAKHKAWTLNIWERKPESKKLKTVWWKKLHDAGTHGTTLLHHILGKRAAFPFPKSIYAVMDAIAAVVRTRPNAIILDFFAGSGSTLHATCMLNDVYPGDRRCILVTNNEVGEKRTQTLLNDGIEPGSTEFEKHGIAESVTWPRTKAVIAGVRQDGTKLPGSYFDGRAMSTGFEANAAFFTLDFLDPAEVARGDSFEAIIPILWMLAGCQGECTLARGRSKWFMPIKNPFAVLIKEDSFSEFEEKLAKRDDITHIFLVTDSPEAFADMAGALDSDYHCVQLYKSYLDTFKINLAKPGSIREAGHAS